MGFFSDLGKSVARHAGGLNLGGDSDDENGLGEYRSYSSEACPECGSTLLRDDFLSEGDSERFECSGHCNNPVWFREGGGRLMDPPERNRVWRASRGAQRTCISCQRPLDGEFTPAWSEGGNSMSTVRCRACGAENIVDYGDDD